MHYFNKTKLFLINPNIFKVFDNLKKGVENAVSNSINHVTPFMVKCDLWDTVVFARLNHTGHPVDFVLSGCKLHCPPAEKEASAIFNPVSKWSYLLLGQHFITITDWWSVVFMIAAAEQR